MRIAKIEITKGDGTMRLSAEAFPRTHLEPIPLWFEVRGLGAAPPRAEGDPFLAGMLVPCMHEGEDIHIEGRLSTDLLMAASLVQDKLLSWHPSLQRVTITCDEAVAQTNLKTAETGPSPRVGCFFSGGVDSWYTLTSHLDTLTDLVLVRGFGTYAYSEELWEQIVGAAREVGTHFGLRLIVAETNIRKMGDKSAAQWGRRQPAPSFWTELLFGSTLVGIALSLGDLLRTVYIASGYESLRPSFPYGSHPALDPLWSTDQLRVIHDVAVSRLDKIQAVAAHPLALRTLRVCTRGQKTGLYNCCQCEKCLRTMLGLKFCGALKDAATFPRALDLRAIKRLTMRGRLMEAYEELEAVAQARGERSISAALRVATGKRKSLYRWAWKTRKDVNYAAMRLARRVLSPRFCCLLRRLAPRAKPAPR